MDLALRANHDRRIASARLREARALWSETSLDRYPTVTAGASYSNEQFSTAATPGTRLIDRDRELYSAGFDAFWLARSQTDTATALVAVYKSLGGGWEIATRGAQTAKHADVK